MKTQDTSPQNCRVARTWQPKYGEAHPRRVSMDVISAKFEEMRMALMRPLTDCGKTGLCDERSHGSGFWCGICCKQG